MQGLIGSHVVDVLVNDGWKVRALDNLEPQTHRRGKPTWINKKAEFVHGDLRDRDTIAAALDKIDVVFHQAAYGGYMPDITKFVHVNSLGTAQMLEVIREKALPVKKVVVASSQAVYSEGAGDCPKHGLVSRRAPGGTIEQRRLAGALSESAARPQRAFPLQKTPRWWGNRLRPDKS